MSEREITSAAFYDFLAEHKIAGTRCNTCGTLHLPPRPICPACHGHDVAWAEISGRGRLRAFTSVFIAPTEMVKAGYGRDNPYCTGIVELEEGPAISAQIVGVDAAHPERISIGMPLRAVFVARGEGEQERTFLAFEPVEAAG